MLPQKWGIFNNINGSFPALPWCCAIGPKKSKKVLRVKNLGGRKCVFSGTNEKG